LLSALRSPGRRRCHSRQRARTQERTHQKRHARRLATHPRSLDRLDLQEKLCRE
jgi:hypothetical protein